MGNILSMIISILIAIPYICTLGMVTVDVHLPNGEEICYRGWLV